MTLLNASAESETRMLTRVGVIVVLSIVDRNSSVLCGQPIRAQIA